MQTTKDLGSFSSRHGALIACGSQFHHLMIGIVFTPLSSKKNKRQLAVYNDTEDTLNGIK